MKRTALYTLSLVVLSTLVIYPATRAAQGSSAPTDAAPKTVQMMAQSTLASGQFVTVEQDHATTGTARIVTENNQRYLEFDAAFDTARGPAVEVVLYRNSTVPVNLDEKDYVTLAPLQSFTGAQRYAIPADLDLSTYQSVAIWCREFNVTFGYAALA